MTPLNTYAKKKKVNLCFSANENSISSSTNMSYDGVCYKQIITGQLKCFKP